MKIINHDSFKLGANNFLSDESIGDLVKKSNTILFSTSNLFPFDLFPDSLIIDQNKVSIVHKEAFGIEDVHSILIGDITDVTVNLNWLFGSIRVTDSNNPRFPTTYSLNHLRKRDAIHARRLIQGLLEVNRLGVQIPTNKNIVKEIEKIGQTKGE